MKRRVFSLLLAALLLVTLLPQVSLLGTADDCDPDVPTDAPTIPTSALPALLAKKDGHILIDVLDAANYETQHIPGSLSIPYATFSGATEPLEQLPDLNQIIYVYCGSGGLTKTAASKLLSLGYKNVYNVGGWKQWATMGLTLAEGPEPDGHDWVAPSYIWSEDNSECTASTVCKTNAEHKKEETVYTLSQVTKQATAEEEGRITYTAYFTGSYSSYYLQHVFETRTKTVATPKLDAADPCAAGHDWDAPTYVWADDCSKVTATRLCKTNVEHYEAETVETTAKVIKEATESAEGEILYTAVFENEAFASQTRTATVPKLGQNVTGIDEAALCNVWSVDFDKAGEVPVSTRDAGTPATAPIIPTSALPALLEKDDGHILVDVLPVDNYQTQHIPGSISLPFATINTSTEVPLADLPDLDQIIYVYCGSGGLTKQATAKLLKMGYTKVYNVGGWKQWATMGLSLAEGPEPDGHDWEEPTYTWNDDLYGCTASTVCKTNPSHTMSQFDWTLSQVTKAATAKEEGEIIWTAYFKGSYSAYYLQRVFENQSRKASIPKLEPEDFCAEEHEWDAPTYVWAADHSKVTATRLCMTNIEHYEAETAYTTVEVIREATAEEEGEAIYTAHFTNEAFQDQSKTVTLPKVGAEPNGHVWGTPSYEWSEDNKTCTATSVCELDPEHILTETVDTLCETTLQPTGEAEGEITYTAFFTNEVFQTQTKKVPTEKLAPSDPCYDGHDWSEPTYKWSEDNSRVTASRTCLKNRFHIETETVESSSEVTLEATLEAEGEITYTAVFTNPAFGTQTKQVATPKLEPEFTGFDDVPEDAYYAAPVEWAVKNDITNGMGNNKFEPNRTCTRGQVVTFLWRAKGRPTPTLTSNPFSDVKTEDYFYDAVLWAVEKEITNGMGNGKFAPGTGCTRGQVVTFLWRAEGKPSVNRAELAVRYQSMTMTKLAKAMLLNDGHVIVDVRSSSSYKEGHIPTAINIPVNKITGSSTKVSQLPDYNQIIYLYCNSGSNSAKAARHLDKLGYTHVYNCGSIRNWKGELVTGSAPGGTPPSDPPVVEPDCEFSDVHKTDWFFEAVLWAVDRGITNGMGNGKFQPYAYCTRAQIVTFLYRDLVDCGCSPE